jgi:hypothetical protein
MSATTTHTNNATNTAGVPPAPPEAHQRAGADWVQIEQKDLDRKLLSGEFFISRAALATLTGEGSTLFDVLDWFNAYPDSITVGDVRQINGQLQALFGFDGSKPNGRAFFVEIDLIPKPAEAAPASLTEIFGEPIHVYTRAQALADGELVDVTTTAAEAGFRTPVALTRAVWADCVEWADADTKRQTVQDEAGRLWDVVWMCMQTARVAKAESSFFFMVYRVPRGGRAMKPKLTRLKACIGPGDAGEPVITIMQPNED